MADVNKIIPFILKWEGNFVNDPDDLGGATNKGETIYVDCSNLKKMTKSRFYNLYKGVYGEINEEEIGLIKGALKDAKTISPKDLKRFGIQ